MSKAERELHRSLVLPPNTPQPEVLRGVWVLRVSLQRSVPGRGLRLAVWGQTEGLRSSVPQAGEWCATGWGVKHHGRQNPGGGLDPQEKQGTIVGEGERRRGRQPQKSPCLHTIEISLRGTSGSGYG